MRLRRKVRRRHDAKRPDVRRAADRGAPRTPQPRVRTVVADLAGRKPRQWIARCKELLAARETEIGKVADRDRGGNSKVTRLAGISVMFP